jgi:hypothetical protein
MKAINELEGRLKYRLHNTKSTPKIKGGDYYLKTTKKL